MLRYSHSLKRVDEEFSQHKQAFLNQLVQATKGEGKNVKPMFPTLKSFYDYEKIIRDLTQPIPVKKEQDLMSAMANISANFNLGGDKHGKSDV